MRDQVGKRLLTRFREVNLVACPQGAALFAQAGLGIVRRVNEQRCRWNIFRLSPPQLFIFDAVVLDPDLTQGPESRDLWQPSRSQRIEHSGEHLPTVRTNQFCQCLAIGLAAREPTLFDAMAVALDPLAITVLQ